MQKFPNTKKKNPSSSHAKKKTTRQIPQNPFLDAVRKNGQDNSGVSQLRQNNSKTGHKKGIPTIAHTAIRTLAEIAQPSQTDRETQRKFVLVKLLRAVASKVGSFCSVPSHC